MKKLLLVVVLFLCCLAYGGPTDTFTSLYPLAGGTWQMKTKKGFICERWKKINSNELQSIGFRVAGIDTVIEEKVRLIKKGDSIYYVPNVTDQNGGKEVCFKLTSSAKGEFVFSNPAHDFPQRVVYQFISRDSLYAWVDGLYKGKYVKQDFRYTRVK
jgi:hypothetical protein